MNPTIGDRLAPLRRARGLTQEQLAEAAGVSVGTIRKLESNERTSARMTTLHALAQPLGVQTTALVGDATEATTRRDPDDDELGLLDLRRILTPARGLAGLVIADAPDGPLTLDGVRQSLRYTDELYHHDRYQAVLQSLPPLLTEARIVAEASTSDDAGHAYALLSNAYRMAGKTLLQLRRLDLAHIALSSALDAAARSSDPDRSGASAVRTMCWLLTRQGRFADAEQLAIATADRVEPRLSRATPGQLANWGWLLLYGAAAAARDNRPDDADAQLDTAAAAAVRLGQLPPTQYEDVEMGGFSTPKVSMMRVETAVVAGEPGRALDLAEQVEPSHVPTPSCRYRHRLDVAWSHLETGANGRAGEVLMDLGRTAPTWMRQQRYARDLVTDLAGRRKRAMSEELAALTTLVGADAA